MQAVRSSSPAAPSSSTVVGSFQTQQQQLQQQQLLQQQQSASRRLLARFTSSLTSKPRSIGDFAIHLDEPHRQYSNGDTVTGHVRLQVLRPVKITHIVISLAGLAQVYKNPGTGSDSGRSTVSQLVGSSSSSKSGSRGAGRYHGNGLATLFDDEVILCGDGRLGDRTYQFNFELQFPTKELPSSVDFERGAITYLISATLTRPTTISPTSTTERQVSFVERIDIAHLYPPKSRTIILDPIVKRSKAKAQAIKMMDASDRKNSNRSRTSDTTPATGRPSSSSQEGERALSPVPSEVSEESRVSSNGVTSNGSVTASPAASFVGRNTHSKTGNGYKTISTVIQPCVGGCLRGDQVSINIKVNHSKYMKSMNGVIVTLYRTARVDTQPALPIGVIESGRKQEEYFARSYTGLGGLSLSGAGSAHIFRKDLAQTVMPLVINPTTLTAEVVAKLRVPEEAFPTISGVPGAMISFKYYLEVIVDIQGRLAGPDKTMNNLSEITSTTMTSSEGFELDWAATTSIGQGILNTTYVRRDKGVVSGVFEIVVGTVDSERRKGKQRAEAVPDTPIQQTFLNVPHHPPAFDSILGVSTSTDHLQRLPSEQLQPQDFLQRTPSHLSYMPSYPEANDRWETNGYHHDYPYTSSTPVPPPQLPDEAQLSEKERLRLAETRLLPSQPPGLDDDTGQASQQPSAPHIDEEGMPLANDVQYDEPAPRDEYAASPPPVNGMNYVENPVSPARPGMHHEAAAHSASSVVTVVAPTDDKQELERSRLQALASAPPEPEPAAGASSAETRPETSRQQSVPNGHVHDSHAEASGSADLPRYER